MDGVVLVSAHAERIAGGLGVAGGGIAGVGGVAGVGGLGVGGVGVGGVGVGGLGVTGLYSPAGLTPGFTPALGAVGGVGAVGLPGQLGVGGITTTTTTPVSVTTGQTPAPAAAGAGSCPSDGSICGQCLVPQGAAPGKYVCCCDRSCKTNNPAQDPAGNCCANFAQACPGQQ